jgi:hypothetical protein
MNEVDEAYTGLTVEEYLNMLNQKDIEEMKQIMEQDIEAFRKQASLVRNKAVQKLQDLQS